MTNFSSASSLKTATALTAITLALTACSYNNTSATTIPIQKHQSNIGPVLTDSSGMTLYTFNKDRAYVSNCNNGCATKWPPLLVSDDAINRGRYSIIVRSDNSKQWAIDGKPLYRWFKDKKPGDTTGHGIKSVWYAAKP